MNSNFLLYMYYLWHCMIYVNIQGEREKELALRGSGSKNVMPDRKQYRDAQLNQVLFRNLRQLKQRYFQIQNMEHNTRDSYRQGTIDTLELKSRLVMLERAKKKCSELENYLRSVSPVN